MVCPGFKACMAHTYLHLSACARVFLLGFQGSSWTPSKPWSPTNSSPRQAQAIRPGRFLQGSGLSSSISRNRMWKHQQIKHETKKKDCHRIPLLLSFHSFFCVFCPWVALRPPVKLRPHPAFQVVPSTAEDLDAVWRERPVQSSVQRVSRRSQPTGSVLDGD